MDRYEIFGFFIGGFIGLVIGLWFAWEAQWQLMSQEAITPGFANTGKTEFKWKKQTGRTEGR